MVADAEQHAAEDADRRERIEARNLADGLVYQAERFLVQAGDGLPAELRAELEGRIARRPPGDRRGGRLSGSQAAPWTSAPPSWSSIPAARPRDLQPGGRHGQRRRQRRRIRRRLLKSYCGELLLESYL